MAFAVPNADDVTNEPVAGIDGNELVHIAVSHENFVESGCAVTTTGSGIQLAVAAGTVVVEGVPVTVSSGNVTPTADGSNPRFSIVTVNGSGTIEVSNGTPVAYSAGSTTPEYPAWPADKTVLAVVYVPAGATSAGQLELVDKRIIRRRDGRIDALSPGTGITGDGTTDDSDAIDTFISAGGMLYFPAATYWIDDAGDGAATNDAAIETVQAQSTDVLCHPDAVFKAATNLDAGLFWFDATTTGYEFRWRGGVIDVQNQKNTTSIPFSSDYTGANVTATSQSVANAFHIAPSVFRHVHISDVVFTGEGAHTVAYDNIGHHWQNAGGDSHIFIDTTSGGSVLIEDCTFLGARDHAIYVTGSNASADRASSVMVRNCRAYWSWGLVSMKAGISEWTVSDCFAFECPAPYQASEAEGGTTARGSFVNCQAYGYHWGFRLTDVTNVDVVAGQLYNAGVLDTTGNDYASGALSNQSTGVLVDGSTRCKVDVKVVGTDANYTTRVQALSVVSEASGTQSLDNHITLFVDQADSVGGESAVASATDPDRTTFVVSFGDDLDDHTGPTILGGGSTFLCPQVWERILTANATASTTTSEYVTPFAAAPLAAGAWYQVDGYIPVSSDALDDVNLGWTWTGSGSESGYWMAEGPGTGVTGVSNSVTDRTVKDWSDTVEVRGHYGTDLAYYIRGSVSSSADATLQFRYAKNSDSGATNATMLAGGWLRIKRVA